MKNENKAEKEEIIVIDAGIDIDRQAESRLICCFSAYMPVIIGDIGF
ncbi:MAG: hypothetical protein JW786_09160 [Desulfobacterales bacterium]|nr:hypothetical protein [Desulfobacterales bacterium]